jgi:hypothetical protein
MEIQQDFKELLKLFSDHKVEYIIVGGYALAHHGAPRYTGDIDLFIKPDKNNAKNIIQALNDFGFGSIGLTEADFSSPGKVVQLGVPPVRIDIITSLTGLTWETAYSGRSNGKYGDLEVFYLGRSQLIMNKKAIGRKKDQADLEVLGQN